MDLLFLLTIVAKTPLISGLSRTMPPLEALSIAPEATVFILILRPPSSFPK
jgi:hypothetical protein